MHRRGQQGRILEMGTLPKRQPRMGTITSRGAGRAGFQVIVTGRVVAEKMSPRPTALQPHQMDQQRKHVCAGEEELIEEGRTFQKGKESSGRAGELQVWGSWSWRTSRIGAPGPSPWAFSPDGVCWPPQPTGNRLLPASVLALSVLVTETRK